MFSVPLRSGLRVCCLQPGQVHGAGHTVSRQLFSRPGWLKEGKASSNWWRKLVSGEAKSTVRAIPVEQTGARAGWTGKSKARNKHRG